MSTNFTVNLNQYPVIKCTIPKKICGIYFLSLRGAIVYVGKSTNVHMRLLQHRDDKYKEFDQVTIMPMPESELDKWERYYIGLLFPPQNRTGGDKIRNSERQRVHKLCCHNEQVYGINESDPFALDHLDPRAFDAEMDEDALCESMALRDLWGLPLPSKDLWEIGAPEPSDNQAGDRQGEVGQVTCERA